MTANWYGVSFWGEENIPKLDSVVMVAQFREQTEIHFKIVTYVSIKLLF